jgi:hypothetical protein
MEGRGRRRAVLVGRWLISFALRLIDRALIKQTVRRHDRTLHADALRIRVERTY